MATPPSRPSPSVSLTPSQKWVVLCAVFLFGRMLLGIARGTSYDFHERFQGLLLFLPMVLCLALPTAFYPRETKPAWVRASTRPLRIVAGLLVATWLLLVAAGTVTNPPPAASYVLLLLAAGVWMTADYREASVPGVIERPWFSSPAALAAAWIVAIIAAAVSTYYWALWLDV